jgi:hypothetical protein
MFNQKKEYILLVFVLLSIANVLALENFDYVISNSAKWQDVYSSVHYANLNGAGSDFLVSTPHGNILLNNIKKTQKILVVSSKDNPFVFNYQSLLLAKGFPTPQEVNYGEVNLELINEMPSISNFIIVSDSYGYNAMAVAPYAKITNSWVFLANRINIYEIDNILSKRKIDNLIIYGFVDQEVTNILAKYNPKTIDTGDRFKDNIEIVKEYIKKTPAKQVVLTNGEFIEKEIMAGTEPVLFTGRENVPDQIRDFLKANNTGIEVGVLIGNDLVGAATNIRRSAGISVMVKFARGARSQSSGIAAVEGLDLFPLPTPYLNLSLSSATYNTANGQLEITYKSDSNIPIYFKGTITLLTNLETKRIGDSDPIFIAPGDFKTITYPLGIKSSSEMQAEIFTLYGDSPSSMDRTLQANVNVNSIEILDKCKIARDDIKSVKYSKQKKSIVITTKNKQDVACWVDIEIKDIILGFRSQIIGTTGSIMIPKQKTKKIYLEQELTESDLEKNPFVRVIAYSGEKENSLVNVFPAAGEDNKFPLEIEGMTLITYAIIAILIIIVILLILFFIMKRREKDDY